MAVPSSGPLQLYGDIGVELGVPQLNVSLGLMSDSAGFTEPDAMSEFYGYVDATAPTAVTNAASNVVETTMRLNGNITSDGGATITERGFYFGTNSASPTNNTKYTVSGTTGSYILNRSGLNANTNYYIWAFATNSVGTTYGSRVTQRTLAAFVPVYADLDAGSSIDGTRAYLSTGWSGASPNGYRFRSYNYYLNPNTGSYINRHYFAGYNTSATNYWNCCTSSSQDIPMGAPVAVAATNTTNRWSIIADQFNATPHRFNSFGFNVGRLNSSYSFPSHSFSDTNMYFIQDYSDSDTIKCSSFLGNTTAKDYISTRSPLGLTMNFTYSG